MESVAHRKRPVESHYLLCLHKLNPETFLPNRRLLLSSDLDPMHLYFILKLRTNLGKQFVYFLRAGFQKCLDALYNALGSIFL
jgi:hypothetical protein